ncbi:permease prefix domain 1-containing protein [Micrococcoides hystricis]|uniref:Permease prefix domain 1-containing protein n=1 Tax=Micrococcoides hystricis TaxID=1572761 RepID=A0ABV6PAJ0_9MICC
MNAIITYIEQMFRPLPNSAEVRRTQTELLQMSEDRYQQLRTEGVSEHEAVGRVITQFGNLDELADDLGIRAEVDEIGEHTVDFSDAKAERYVEMRRRSSYLIAGGVALILIGITAISLLSSDGGVFGDNMMNFNFSEPIGLAIFFIAVAAAVGMFIFAAFREIVSNWTIQP